MSAILVPVVPGGGNTNIPPGTGSRPKKTQDSPVKRWCFTINNPIKDQNFDQFDNLHQYLKSSSKVFVFQEEIASTGTPHIQGYMECKEKIRFTALRKIKQFEKAHLEPCKDPKAAIKYCQKDDTRNGRCIIEDGERKLSLITPDRPWQVEILNFKHNDRQIEWYVDRDGKKGKSAFCKYLVAKHHVSFFQGGKGSDLLYALTTVYKANEIDDPRLKWVVYDFAREADGHINYSSMESIKNGLWFSPKYEGCQVAIDNPRVTIFANWPPNFDALSKDRWVVKIIKNDFTTEDFDISKWNSEPSQL